jgi:hypothetical protein
MKDKKKSKNKKKKKSKDKKKHSGVMCEPIVKQESFTASLWRKFQIWLRT